MHKIIIPIAAASVLSLGAAGVAYTASSTDRRAGPGAYDTSTSGANTSGTTGTYGTSTYGTSTSGTTGTYGTSTSGTTGTYGTSGAYGASTSTSGANGGTTSGTSTTSTTPSAKGGGPAAASASAGMTGMAGTAGMTGMTGQSCAMDDAHKTAAVLQFLHETNLAEIKEGNLAPTRASSADVKTYAADLVKAHTDADTKLTDLAKKKGIDLARGTIGDPIHSAVLSASDANVAMLGAKTGKTFDTAFVAPEVHEHTLAIKVVDEGLKVVKDAEVKVLLTDVRVALVKHQLHASKLQDQLAMGASAPGTGTGTGIGGGPKSDDTTMPGTKGTVPGKAPKSGDPMGK